MLWRDWISKRYVDRAEEERPEFRDGATPERLAKLETELGLPLPASLRELLLESDGVDLWMYCQNNWFKYLTVVWSCDQILEKNRSLNNDPQGPGRPPDMAPPLFFANPGVDGVLFAVLVNASSPADPAVYAYSPMEHEWEIQAPSLKDHLHGWVG